jgi:(p)ppGpp synthase/HD superfamily hydrolase
MRGGAGVGERAAAMAQRVREAAVHAGTAEVDAARLGLLLEAAVAAREPDVPEPDHPDYLHPARSALILMMDAGVADAELLAAAMLFDSRPGRPCRLSGLAREFGAETDALLRAVPAPHEAEDAGALLEALVTAPAGAALAASAERLDHARHLHLRAREEWAAFHALAEAAYAPAAGRAHPALARRWARWTDMFRSRWLALP